MPTIAEACCLLQAAAMPVLFTDTCTLVDVIRAPMRPVQLRGCVKASQELLELLTLPPPQCSLVTASLVRGEWQTYAVPTAGELRKHLEQLDNFAAEFHDCCSHTGLMPAFDRAAYRCAGLTEKLYDLSRGLLDKAIHLLPEDTTGIRAYQRALSCTPPSRKGGELTDCTILEECLEVCRQLRHAGFVKKLVFCTSNTQDYCDGTRPHATLAAEFSRVSLAFTTNLRWAVHEVTT